MILITGGFGKLGNSLVKEIKNKKIFFIKRGNKYKKIAHNVVSLNLNNKNHLKKLFKSYKFSTLIHLAVTRNPLKIKNIRDTSTLIKDTNISINFLNEMRNIKKIILASTFYTLIKLIFCWFNQYTSPIFKFFKMECI